MLEKITPHQNPDLLLSDILATNGRLVCHSLVLLSFIGINEDISGDAKEPLPSCCKAPVPPCSSDIVPTVC